MRSLFIALLVALPAIIFAQANYHEGYVLKNNGDTVKGYINYREWAYSPESVEFKTDKSGNDVQEFDPRTIKGFRITGYETYMSYRGLISMNKNIFPDIPSNLDTTRQLGSIFLKLLTTGNHLTLYFNTEVHKNRFFIAEKNGQPVELQYYEYYGTSNSDEVYDNLYRGQLILLINKYSKGDTKLINKIGNVRFEQADLEEIVNSINNVDPAKQKNRPAAEKSSSKFRFFGGVGANSTTTKYNYLASTTGTDLHAGGAAYSYNYNTLHSSGTSPKINLGLDIFTNPNVQQFVFRVELGYSSSNASFSENINSVNGSVNILTFALTQYTTSITPQLLYNVYNTDKLKIYMDAGAAINLSSYSNKPSSVNQNMLGLKSFWAYYPFQAGVVFNKKIEIYVAYTTYGTYTENGNVSVGSQSTSVGAKYLF